VGHGKKYLKITEALQYPLMGRKIFFVRGHFPEDIHKVLVDELVHLGQWGHDDVADCLSLFFHPDIKVIAPRYTPSTWKVPMSRPMQTGTGRSNAAAQTAFFARQNGATVGAPPPPVNTSDAILQEAGRVHRFGVAGWGGQPRPQAFKYDPLGYLKGGSE
jgi:hypothetical protein